MTCYFNYCVMLFLNLLYINCLSYLYRGERACLLVCRLIGLLGRVHSVSIIGGVKSLYILVKKSSVDLGPLI